MVGRELQKIMVGGTSAAALGALALHATLLAPTHVAADMEASTASIDLGAWDADRAPHEPTLPQHETIIEPPSEPAHVRKLGCGTMGWHPDIESESGCTNSDKWPEAWERPGLKERMFHPTADGCCEFMFNRPGQTCNRIDACGGGSSAGGSGGPKQASPPPPPPPPAPGASGCLGWHVDMANQDGCSDDDNYPAAWTRGNALNIMFHDTAAECCQSKFRDKPCKTYNRGCGASAGGSGGPPPAPAPAPSGGGGGSSGCQWHVDLTNQDGCTDDSNYPAAWTMGNTKNVMFHATADICCDKMMPGRPCRKYPRGCDGPVVPGQMPGPRPTPRPTPRRTQEPTKAPEYYYIEDMSGMCISTYEKPPPHWIKQDQWFPVYDACCQKAQDKQKCLKARPSQGDGDSFGTPQPSPAPPARYWRHFSTGMCVVDGGSTPMPDWATGAAYEDYRRCCILEASDAEECLKHDPNKVAAEDGGGTWPTESPVLSPPEWYVEDASGVCVNHNEQPMPWDKPTFGNYRECCESGPPTTLDKCLLAEPSLPPTNVPTEMPSTMWPTDVNVCPKAYDGSTTYFTGTKVESGDVAYRCKRGAYCNRADFRPPLEDPGPEIVNDSKPNNRPVSNIPIASTGGSPQQDGSADNGLWKEAWERLHLCIPPTSDAPTVAPSTPKPTCANASDKWHPMYQRRVCTNDVDYPPLWNEEPLATSYFAASADECCEKFYGGTRCRIRDACE